MVHRDEIMVGKASEESVQCFLVLQLFHVLLEQPKSKSSVKFWSPKPASTVLQMFIVLTQTILS